MKTKNKTFSIFLSILVFVGGMDIYAQSVNDNAPDFELKDLAGNNFKLSDQKNKVVFIFFFGYGCSHCHTNAPNTQIEVYEHFKDRDDFVAVGVDTWDGNNQQVTNFKASTGLSYTMLLNGSGVASNFSSTYDRIIVVDKEGVIKFKSSGFATKQTSAEAQTVIESLLGNITGDAETLVDDASLGLYPNPAYSYISVNNPFSEKESIYIDIIDVTGRVFKLSEFISQGKRLEISIDNIPEGYYMLRLHNNSGDIRLARIIKKN